MMRPSLADRNLLFVVVAVSLLYGFAATLRYPAPWAEGDTAFFARTIAALIQYGTLDEAWNPHIYPQGFVYQAWAGSLVLVTGVSVDRFIGILSPVLGSLLLGIASFAAFSRFLGSAKGGFLATMTLFLIPEVMFSVLRGNHEKITLTMTLLTFLSFLALVTSTTHRVRSLSWRIVFFLALGSSVAANVYFGSLIVVALSIVFVGLWPLYKLVPTVRATLHPLLPQLTVAVVSGWLTIGLVMLVIYPPSGHLLRVVPNLLAGLQGLAETTATGTFAPTSNPYATAGSDWVSTRVYQLLSLVRWIVFFASFGVWLAFLAQAIRRPDARTHLQMVGLALYGAFGFILALSIPIDLIGLDVGSNLQVRVYVYFGLFSAPILAMGLLTLFTAVRGSALGSAAASIAAVLFAVFLFGGFLKAVNDPLVSNVWRFYAPTEVAAIDFYLEHQPNRLRTMWIGADTRLRDAFSGSYPHAAVDLMRFDATGIANPSGINLVSGNRLDAAFAIDSTLIRHHSALLTSVRAPPASLGSRVYDNGDAWITYLDEEAWSLR